MFSFTMPISSARAELSGLRVPRVLGRYWSGRPGTRLVVLGGLHGNEPAGVLAVQRVLRKLHESRLPLRGELIGLAGNLPALERDLRFIARDLNRHWQPKYLEALQAGLTDPSVEDLQQRELAGIFQELHGRADRPIVFLDLHSTSSSGAPFCVMADVLRNRPPALALRIPVILGLEETIDGTLLGWLVDQGHIGIAVEGGQHRSSETLAHHEAALWLVLVALDCLEPAAVEGLDGYRRRLAAAARRLPRFVEIRYRHAIRPEDDFRMLPGFVNFQSVAKGQLLAHDLRGELRAQERGRILMPLYQTLGDDGFFLTRDVRPFWLWLSALLRRLRFDRLAPLLPGVRRHPQLEDHYLVDPKIARFFTVEIFHLLGYRRERPTTGLMAFSRRRPGFLRLQEQR
jgi:succinylglutamate desuccinylase